MRYLLDTCTVSEAIAKTPNPRVVDYLNALSAPDVFLSVITIGEIAKGIAKLPRSKKRDRLQKWFEVDLLGRFDANIVPVDLRTALRWGELSASLQVAGRPLPAIDSLLAAQCLVGNFTLVTRNTRDFEPAGVRTDNPWGAP